MWRFIGDTPIPGLNEKYNGTYIFEAILRSLKIVNLAEAQ